MTNEDIAVRIKKGDKKLVSVLWERIHEYIFMLAQRWHYSNEDYYSSYGIALDDLKQCGYFALLKAVDRYSPEKEYPIFAYIKHSLKNEIQSYLKKSEGLNCYTSLNVPALSDGDESLAYLIEDDKNKPAHEQVECDITAEIVRTAVNNLKPKQKSVIFGIYFENMEIERVAEKSKISAVEAMKIRNAAFTQLRKDSGIKELRNIRE